MIQRVALICGIAVLERMSFYGLRAALLLFLLKAVGWEITQASSFYGLFTAIVIIGPVFTGLISDLTKRPMLVAIIGSGLTTVGSFGLAFATSDFMVKMTLMVVAVGSALYKPTIISTLYRVTWPNKQYFDLVYSTFYFCVNVGAILAALLIISDAVINNSVSFHKAFLISGCLSLVVTVLLSVFYNNLTNKDILYNKQTYTLTGNAVAIIILFSLCNVIFWSGYEIYKYVELEMNGNRTQSAMAIFAILLGLLIVPLSLFTRFRGAWKIGVGLVISCLVYFLMASIGFSGKPAMFALTIAELLVTPILVSQLIQKGSPRFTGTLVGGMILMTFVTNKLVGMIFRQVSQGGHASWLIVASLLLLVVGFGIFLLDYLRSHNPASA